MATGNRSNCSRFVDLHDTCVGAEPRPALTGSSGKCYVRGGSPRQRVRRPYEPTRNLRRHATAEYRSGIPPVGRRPPERWRDVTLEGRIRMTARRRVNIWSKGEVVDAVLALVESGTVKGCAHLKVLKGHRGAYYVKCLEDWASWVQANNVDLDPTGYSAPSSYFWPQCPVNCPKYKQAEDLALELVVGDSQRREKYGVSRASIKLFISHASEDAEVAARLIQLLRTALNLPATAVRCTSVDGYRLPGGANTNEQLRREVHEAEAFIGIVSSHSIRSLYVLFELGARWGAGKHLVPLLAPGTPSDVLGGPLAGINALRADNVSQLHQLVSEIAAVLGLQPEDPAVYEHYVVQLAHMRPRRHNIQSAEPIGTPTEAGSDDIFARLEEMIPELLAEMKQDLSEHPYAREFVILSRNWSYNADPNKITLVYYFEDHPDLRNKLRILENYGLITEITYNNTERFVISEALAKYLTSGLGTHNT